MTGKRRVTREMIVDAARRIVAEQGTGALTFQALASRLGVSKQAIIYWYPSKQELVRDFCLPVLAEERDVLLAALDGTRSAAEAVERYVRALVTHHLRDLGRFRMVYLWIQFEPDISPATTIEHELLDPVHAATSSAYDVLEAKIAADASFVGEQNPRRLAVAIDMAAIGLITMLAMAESMNDPWKHKPEDLLNALVGLVTRPAGPVVRRTPTVSRRRSNGALQSS